MVRLSFNNCNKTYNVVNNFVKENLQWPATLRALMAAKGEMSNPALGREIKVSHVTIGNYLNGQFPKGDDLAAIADFFGTSTDALLGREPIPPVPQVQFQTQGYALHDAPSKNSVDDLLFEVQNIRESLYALERKIKKLKK